MTKPPKKFIPVMLTPFSQDGSIDYQSLTELTAYYIKSGAQGLFANCLSSEMFELSAEERIRITRHVMEVADGAVPVLSTGSFGGNFSNQLDFINRLQDTGVQSIILSSGMMVDEHESDALFAERFDRLLSATGDINFGFYECPVPYKRIVSPALLSTFLRTGRVHYFKDTSLDIGVVREKIKVGEGYAFGLYDAYIVHAVESLKAGSAGLSCIQGNFFPELIVWLCDNYDNALLSEEVAQVQHFLSANMDVMHDVYPVVAKMYLGKRGMNIKNFSRRKVGQVNARVIKNLDQLYADYAQLENKLELSGSR